MPAPLRIRRPAATLAAGPADGLSGWMERLVKLVPSEIIAVYLAGRSAAAAFPGAWSVVCLALLVVVRVWGTREPPRGAQWIAVAISAVSFVIWVLAIGGPVLSWSLDSSLASLLVLVWTTLVPVIYRGD